MATQTGTIELGATAGVKTVAEGWYNSISNDLSQNYYTKSEFSVAPGQIASTIASVDQKIDGISVGGRNLLLKTATPFEITISPNSSGWGAPDIYQTVQPFNALFVEGDTVTFSFDWEYSGTPTGNFHTEMGNASPYTAGTVIKASGTRSATSQYVDLSSSNASGHVVVTYRVTSAAASATDAMQWFRIRYDNATAGDTLTISNAKMERGNMATDWTPAPEDVDAIKNLIGGPNLSPYYSVTPYENGDYWKSVQLGNGFTFTSMGDGWMRVQCSNSGSSVVRRDWYPVKSQLVEPGAEYTWLVEIRNNASTAVSSGSDFYLVQTNNLQFWGQKAIKTLNEAATGVGTGTSVLINVGTCGETAVMRKVQRAETASDGHWTNSDEANVVGLACWTTRCAAGQSIDYEVRVSLYEGEYTGPYKPFVDQTLSSRMKAAEASIVINADQISSTVSEMNHALVDNYVSHLTGGGVDTADDAYSGDAIVSATVDGLSVQDGTPTPAAPVEIRSVEGAAAVVAGRNLLNPSVSFSTSFYTVNADGTVTVNSADTATWNIVPLLPLPAGTYTLSIISGNDGRCAYHAIDSDSDTAVLVDGNASRTFTIGSGGGLKLKLYNGTFPRTVRIMLVSGATAPTVFEPFAGRTSTSLLPSTAAPLRSLPDGTHDELTVARDGTVTVVRRVGSVTYDGSSDEAWVYENAAAGPNFYIRVDDAKKPQYNNTLQCNTCQTSTINGSQKDRCFISGGRNLNITIGETIGVSSAAAFKTWLASHNVTADYQLDAPTTETYPAITMPTVPSANITAWVDAEDADGNHLAADWDIGYHTADYEGTAQSEVEERLSSAESSIVQNAHEISIKVSQSDFEAGVSDAATKATGYITDFGANGVKVHPLSSTSDYALIDETGLNVFDGGVSVAKFGSTARIGATSGEHVVVDSDGMHVNSGQFELASFGRDVELGKYGHDTHVKMCDGLIDISGEDSTNSTIATILTEHNRVDSNGNEVIDTVYDHPISHIEFYGYAAPDGTHSATSELWSRADASTSSARVQAKSTVSPFGGRESFASIDVSVNNALRGVGVSSFESGNDIQSMATIDTDWISLGRATTTYVCANADGFRTAIGAAASSHTHSYLPLSGGTLTNTLNIDNSTMDRDGTNPSSAITGKAVTFRDKDGERVGLLRVDRTTAGVTQLLLVAYNEDTSNNEKNHILQLNVARDGTRSVSVSDPAAWRSALGITGTTTSNTNQIGSIGSGVTVSSVITRKNLCVCSVRIVFKKSSAIAANASVTVGTLTSGNRPVGCDARGVVNINGAQVNITTAGVVTFWNGGSSSIAANTEIIVHATYAL